jgi:catechol-2,3-dioxygenase
MLRQQVFVVVSYGLPSLAPKLDARVWSIAQFEQHSKQLVGEIKLLWVKRTPASTKFYAQLQGFEITNVDDHYQMRSIVRTPHHVVVNTKVRLGLSSSLGSSSDMATDHFALVSIY